VRVIPDGVIDRAAWRNTLMARLHRNLQVGVEYNPLAGEVGPLVNWRALQENRRRPALSFGTSSDRIGTPYGRAYYATLSYDLQPAAGIPVGVYFGPLWGSFDDELLFPFGATLRLGKRWSVTPSFDGHAFHQLIGYSWGRYTLTGILVRGRHPGMAINVGF
jgi:hypothetical protein